MSNQTESGAAIAKVIRDLRNGVITPLAEVEVDLRRQWQYIVRSCDQVVDVTKVYEQFTEDSKAVRLYEDHVFLPPWDDALIGYVNEYGNVHVAHVITSPADVVDRWVSDQHWIDWDAVEWVTTAVIYMGGYSTTRNRPVPTQGPLHGWAIASNKDGTIQDIRWIHLLPDEDMHMWDNMLICLLKTYDFLACSNVEVAEPHRKRATHRRIQREIGETKVTEIVVRPMSRYTKSGGDEGLGMRVGSVPLHTVRGHFVRYGPEYGRQLLFGKYAGRFWVPGHARGNDTAGIREHNYTLESE